MEHRVGAGIILSQTFRIFFANFAGFFLICALVLSPALGLQAWALADVGDPTTPTASMPFVLAWVLSLVLTPVATAALIYGVFRQLRGKHANAVDCLKAGLKRLFPVLGVSIVSIIIQGVGLMLLIVPGLIALCVLAAAVPAVVIERPGVFGALNRSVELTHGYRWSVFAVWLALFVFQWAVGMTLGFSALISPNAYMIGNATATIVFTGLQATAYTLIYYHLRKAKEAIDVEDIAAVFD